MEHKGWEAMKMLMTILITALLAWVTSYMFAWWMIVVVPFLVAVIIKQKPGKGFVNGFLSIALLWLVFICVKDSTNDTLLSGRVAQLFNLPHIVFIILNVFVGGLVGGLGGWSGACMWRIFKEKNQ